MKTHGHHSGSIGTVKTCCGIVYDSAKLFQPYTMDHERVTCGACRRCRLHKKRDAAAGVKKE